MKHAQINILEHLGVTRTTIRDSIGYALEALREYGQRHKRWVIAWSGGKDSTAVLTFTIWAIESGKVPRPDELIVLYADTRMELLPLAESATRIREDLVDRGWITVKTVMAPMDKRYFVYMLGRGVPPPNNGTLRWCTRSLKIDPMADELKKLSAEMNDFLMLTGVRQGESAIRDGRISLSCSLDGSECGQARYHRHAQDKGYANLDPILSWRVCHVWAWLREWAPLEEYGGWDTELLADAYGGDEAEEIAARTGCVGCPLATKDKALDFLLTKERWSYLAPLTRLRPMYRELRLPKHRLRKPAGESRKDGTLSSNQCRMGPLKLETRLWALDQVLAIQAEVNAGADGKLKPRLDLLNAEEEARIRELIAAGTWPQKWTGEEPGAEEPFDEPCPDGQQQTTLGLFDDWNLGEDPEP